MSRFGNFIKKLPMMESHPVVGSIFYGGLVAATATLAVGGITLAGGLASIGADIIGRLAPALAIGGVATPAVGIGVPALVNKIRGRSTSASKPIKRLAKNEEKLRKTVNKELERLAKRSMASRGLDDNLQYAMENRDQFVQSVVEKLQKKYGVDVSVKDLKSKYHIDLSKYIYREAYNALLEEERQAHQDQQQEETRENEETKTKEDRQEDENMEGQAAEITEEEHKEIADYNRQVIENIVSEIENAYGAGTGLEKKAKGVIAQFRSSIEEKGGIPDGSKLDSNDKAALLSMLHAHVQSGKTLVSRANGISEEFSSADRDQKTTEIETRTDKREPQENGYVERPVTKSPSTKKKSIVDVISEQDHTQMTFEDSVSYVVDALVSDRLLVDEKNREFIKKAVKQSFKEEIAIEANRYEKASPTYKNRYNFNSNTPLIKEMQTYIGKLYDVLSVHYTKSINGCAQYGMSEVSEESKKVILADIVESVFANKDKPVATLGKYTHQIVNGVLYDDMVRSFNNPEKITLEDFMSRLNLVYKHAYDRGVNDTRFGKRTREISNNELGRNPELVEKIHGIIVEAENACQQYIDLFVESAVLTEARKKAVSEDLMKMFIKYKKDGNLANLSNSLADVCKIKKTK